METEIIKSEEQAITEIITGDLYFVEGAVVMATNETPRDDDCFAGAIIHIEKPTDRDHIGAHHNNWAIDKFKPFKGKIILTQ